MSQRMLCEATETWLNFNYSVDSPCLMSTHGSGRVTCDTVKVTCRAPALCLRRLKSHCGNRCFHVGVFVHRLSVNVIRASGGSKAATLVLDQTVEVWLPVCASSSSSSSSSSLRAIINTSRMEEECEKTHRRGGGGGGGA